MVSVSQRLPAPLHSLRPGLVVVTEQRGDKQEVIYLLRTFFNKNISPIDCLEAHGRLSAEESREHLNRFFSV